MSKVRKTIGWFLFVISAFSLLFLILRVVNYYNEGFSPWGLPITNTLIGSVILFALGGWILAIRRW